MPKELVVPTSRRKASVEDESPFKVTFSGVEKTRRRKLSGGGTEVSVTRTGRLNVSAAVGGKENGVSDFAFRDVFGGFGMMTSLTEAVMVKVVNPRPRKRKQSSPNP